MAGAVVAEDEGGVAVVGKGQGQEKGRVEVETISAAEATGHGIRRGKVKTRRDRRTTIESEDTTKK